MRAGSRLGIPGLRLDWGSEMRPWKWKAEIKSEIQCFPGPVLKSGVEVRLGVPHVRLGDGLGLLQNQSLGWGGSQDGDPKT